MSHCEGVSIFASGDYLLDERQGYLCSTIERLRLHMITLKEKLHEEKMLLSELKAETQHLTMQHDNASTSEDYQQNSSQSRPSESQNSLNRSFNLGYADDLRTKMAEEPARTLERAEYEKRLREIDSLCKEEMARVNSVVEQMEPLKQIASDWMLETKLKEVSVAQPAAKETAAVLDGDGVQHYLTQSGIEHVVYNSSEGHMGYESELIVLRPGREGRLTPPTPVFIPDAKCDMQLNPPILIQTSDMKSSSQSKPELKLTKETELKLDCVLKHSPRHGNNTFSAAGGKGILEKKPDERTTRISSSEASLSSLEALKEKNITLTAMEGTKNTPELGKSKKKEEKAEEDWKSTASEKTSKSAISLESIQRAFAEHHKKRHKLVKSESSSDALSFLGLVHKKRENKPLNKTNDVEVQRKEDKLFSYLHPSAQKIVKNWVMVGREERKQKSSAKRKSECSKRCTLNLGRNKKNEEALCEDDVINKFLYDEEGYVYTPLFVSETEGDCSSDSNCIS